MAWTEDWSDPQMMVTTLPYYEELQVAINERIDVANDFIISPAGPITKPAFLENDGAKLVLWSEYELRLQIESAIDDLGDDFFVEDKDWTGLVSSIKPHTNIGALMLVLGESRLTIPQLGESAFEWMSQQKRILDMMTVCKQSLTGLIGSANSERRTGLGTTYANAVTAWNAAAWTSVAATTNQASTNEDVTRPVAELYRVERHRRQVEISGGGNTWKQPTVTQEWAAGDPTYDPKKTWNCYMTFYRLAFGNSGYYRNEDYVPGSSMEGVSTTQFEVGKIYTETTPTDRTTDEPQILLDLGYFNSINSGDVVTPGIGSNTWGWMVNITTSPGADRMVILMDFANVDGLEKY